MLSKKALLNYLPLLLVVVLASVLRLLWLDKVPNAIGGDELVYILNAKAIFLTGHDIFGVWSPIQALAFILPKGDASAELLYFLSLPLVGITNFSILTAHLTGAILSIFLVIAVYFVAKELLGKNVGIIAGLIAAINPWLIYIGRTLYEATPAMLFYLVALYVLLKARGRNIYLALPFLFLAFYSYIGTKFIFLPFVLVVIIYCFLVKNKKAFLKEYLGLFIICVVFVACYLVSLQFHPETSTRMGELFTPNDPSIVKQVNDTRSDSMANPLLNIFVNKYSMYANIITTKLLKSFAADYLFVSGDGFFSIWRHGLFYYTDALFIFLGALFLFNKKRTIFGLLSALILIGVLPQVFHGARIDNYTLHLTLIFPFLTIVIALGIWETIALFKSRRLKLISGSIIFITYLVLVLNFLNIYFFWFPLQGYFDFQVRPLSKYIMLVKASGREVVVYSSASADIFKKYLFYTNSYNKDTYPEVRAKYKKNDIAFQNVIFTGCDNSIDPTKTNKIIIYDDFACGNLLKANSHLTIPRLSDGGESYQIYNDSACSNYALKQYPVNLKISDFSIENQSPQKFCETFITRF
jgi:4-amino-4-deoxy-L-arabinose transferase-like glycosyltransferase